jgi:nicotinamide-nucleotide amidase
VVGGRVLRALPTDEGEGALNAEIVGVGTELLLGQIVNTNAAEISRGLAAIGIDVYFHSVVGDNPQRMRSVIDAAMSRSDVVILTGGLGPTPDDITREAVADVLGVKLVRHPRLVGMIEDVFKRMGRDMPEENRRQADIPDGARTIDPVGTAPGFWFELNDKLLFALPGVPWEMKAMLTETVIPELSRRSGEGVTLSREILVVGLGESRTYDLIRDIVDEQTNPTIAFRAGEGQVRVRMTAKAAGEAEALEAIAPVDEAIRARLGESAPQGHHSTVGEALVDLLKQCGLKVAAAESLTGGLIGAELTRAPGSSDYFLGSLVCYSTAAKAKVAGVSEEILREHGPVSAEVAGALAEGAARAFDADLGVSATGVAGPEPQDGAPVGTIFIGATMHGHTETRHVRGYGDRTHVQRMAVTAALDLGRRLVSRAQ